MYDELTATFAAHNGMGDLGFNWTTPFKAIGKAAGWVGGIVFNPKKRSQAGAALQKVGETLAPTGWALQHPEQIKKGYQTAQYFGGLGKYWPLGLALVAATGLIVWGVAKGGR